MGDTSLTRRQEFYGFLVNSSPDQLNSWTTRTLSMSYPNSNLKTKQSLSNPKARLAPNPNPKARLAPNPNPKARLAINPEWLMQVVQHSS